MTPQDIIDTTQAAIDRFQQSLPGVQKGLLKEISLSLKQLQTSAGGDILNNVNNLKLVNALRNKIERLIVSQGYKSDAKDFVKAFDQVEALQLEYFASFNQKFTPNKTLPIIKNAAIGKTLNDLVSQGLQINVVDKLHDILKQNVTTGGSYASLTDQLRQSVVGSPEQEGFLARYGRTITTDAINQFSAQYHDTLAQDLGFDWGRYIGSNITTTREFCEFLTAKQWVHRSELPEILTGLIDGHQCKLNKQGLPLGMIPGTDANNFQVRRGGYNCGHQFFYVPDSAVPAAVKAALNNPVIKKEEPAPPTPKPVPKPVPVPQKTAQDVIAENILTNSAATVKNLESRGFNMAPDLLKYLPDDKMKIETQADEGSFYNFWEDKIVIGTDTPREASDYYTKKLLPHEIGHAIHFKEKIILPGQVSPEFEDFYKSLKKIIKGKERALDTKINQEYWGNYKDVDKRNQMGVIADILGSLTRGKLGFGHKKSYYKLPGYSEMEIFAHGMSFLEAPNASYDITPEMKQIVEMMTEYSKKVLQDISTRP